MTMLKFLVGGLLFGLLVAFVHGQRPTVQTLDEYRVQLRPLLDAIRHVESGGDDRAVGDQGRSIGPYQIQQAYWRDARSWCRGLRGAYTDCYARDYAERCIVAYWHRYCRRALRNGDLEQLARVHNGGPQGHRKAATDPYWAKVKAQITRQRSH